MLSDLLDLYERLAGASAVAFALGNEVIHDPELLPKVRSIEDRIVEALEETQALLDEI